MPEYFTDESSEHRFRVQADNGEILMTSEGYTSEQGAERGYEALKKAIHSDGNGCNFQQVVKSATTVDALDWAARCLYELQSDGAPFADLSEDKQIEYANLADKFIRGLLLGEGREA